jgi:UTP--glucose-1-phosphate uridylyltransferase
MLRSDLYQRGPGAFFDVNPARASPELPHFKLGDLYTKVQDYEARVQAPVGILNLDSLEVEGDVTFGKGVVLEGTVVFKAPAGEKWVVPDGKVYKNATITSQGQL